jgi:NADP-dependent 3-hydroxy acid dehydrogenase YdfG
MQRRLREFEGGEYDESAYLRPETVADVVAKVISTPPDGHVHQIVVRQRG